MKTKSILSSLAVISCLLIAVYSCSKDLSYNTRSVDLDVAEEYQYDFSTSATVTLGRVLFYDQSLSINNAVSCGSCHKQAFAFADNSKLSQGFENFTGNRNTPPIQNLSSFSLATFSPNSFGGQALFWDGRERSLLDMVTQPIFNHVEMGVKNPSDMVNRVKAKSYYPALFKKAFGNEDIDMLRISEALMAFVGNITSNRSKFDAFNFFGNISQNDFSPAERRGQELFFGKYNCASCHQLHSPSGYFANTMAEELVNIGLDNEYADKGFGELTGNASDNGRFKMPNLRNIALTAPYMHDGRFTTLEEVIDHYSTGIKNHPNLDVRLKDSNGQPLVLNITEQDKRDLIAFLQTLTDNQMITDPKFSDPFKTN